MVLRQCILCTLLNVQYTMHLINSLLKILFQQYLYMFLYVHTCTLYVHVHTITVICVLFTYMYSLCAMYRRVYWGCFCLCVLCVATGLCVDKDAMLLYPRHTAGLSARSLSHALSHVLVCVCDGVSTTSTHTPFCVHTHTLYI